jgi:single-strand DNA-binding protein
MKNVNRVFLLGNISREPDIKVTTSGKKVAVFGIATNRDWNRDGEKSSLTEFHNCIAWGRLADLCEMYLAKGQLVYGEGYLKTRSWEDENGTRQFRTEVVLIEIIILEKFSKKPNTPKITRTNTDSNPEAKEQMESGSTKLSASEDDYGEDFTDFNDNLSSPSSDSIIDQPLFEEEK